MTKIVIKNGHLIDPANHIDHLCDIRIADGNVLEVGPDLIKTADEQLCDASGLIVCPGFIDIHCHLREPGQEAKEDLISGTNAAAAGGFTTILTMANTRPVIDQAIIVSGMQQRIRQDALVHVEITGAITKGLQGKELAEMGDMAQTGVAAFSDDGFYVDDSQLMRSAFEYSTIFGKPLISHAEESCLVADGVMHEGCVSAKLGLRGRPAMAENIAVARELMLAELTGGWVHIAHVTTKGAVNLIRAAKHRGVKVTAEVSPHHLCLSDIHIETFNTAYKVNPPLRSNEHIAALIAGLEDGTLDAIATDHAPHAYEEKDCEFNHAPCGFAGFETAFSVLYTHFVKSGKWSLPFLIEKMTCAPANTFKWARKGHLSPGTCADLLLIDLSARWQVNAEHFFTRGKVTPFDGHQLVSKVKQTMVKGCWVYQDGKVLRNEDNLI